MNWPSKIFIDYMLYYSHDGLSMPGRRDSFYHYGLEMAVVNSAPAKFSGNSDRITEANYWILVHFL